MSMNILVVDDDPTCRTLLTMQLGFLNVTPQVAASGPEALRKVKETVFDMILLDCQMPDFDGFLTAAALREAGYAAPIVGLSAEEGESIRESCLQAGMTGYRPKPIDMDVTSELIGTYLQGPPSPREEPRSIAGGGAHPMARVRAICARPEQAKSLVEVFLRCNDGVVERLEAALAGLEQDAALAHLHRLKGSAGSFGAEEFGHRVSAVEEKVQTEGLLRASESVVSLLKAWGELRSVLLQDAG